jgi:hypothetical protein
MFSAIWIVHYIAERQYPARKGASRRTSVRKQKPDPARLTLGPATKKFHVLCELDLDVNHVRYAPVAPIYQHNVSAYDVINKVRRWWRQSAIQIGWNFMQSRAPAGIEHESHLQSRFPISRKPVLNSESDNRMLTMLSPPSVHNYAFVIIKCRMLPIPIVVMAFLRKRIAPNKH